MGPYLARTKMFIINQLKIQIYFLIRIIGPFIHSFLQTLIKFLLKELFCIMDGLKSRQFTIVTLIPYNSFQYVLNNCVFNQFCLFGALVNLAQTVGHPYELLGQYSR
jgi:hypothetical protein